MWSVARQRPRLPRLPRQLLAGDATVLTRNYQDESDETKNSLPNSAPNDSEPAPQDPAAPPAPPDAPPPPKELKRHIRPSNLVILGPKATARRIPKLQRSQRSQEPRDPNNDSSHLLHTLRQQQELLMNYKADVTPADVAQNINSLKPEHSILSPSAYDKLVNSLTRGFTSAQLKAAISAFRRETPASVKLQWPPKKAKKSQIVDFLIQKLWRIEKATESDQQASVTVERVIPISKRDLCLLMHRRASWVTRWTKTGALIKINADNNLLIRGTLYACQWIETEVQNILESVVSEEVDLTNLWHLYGSRGIPFLAVERLAAVYFEPLVEEFDEAGNLRKARYVISGLSRQAIGKAKRYLVYSLDSSSRLRSAVVYDEGDGAENVAEQTEKIAEPSTLSAYRVVDEAAVPWTLRGQTLARIRTPRKSLRSMPESEPVSRSEDLFNLIMQDLDEKSDGKAEGKAEAGRETSELSLSPTSPFREEELTHFQQLLRRVYRRVQNGLADVAQQTLAVAEAGEGTETEAEEPVVSATFGFVLQMGLLGSGELVAGGSAHIGSVSATQNPKTAESPRSATLKPENLSNTDTKTTVFSANIPLLQENIFRHPLQPGPDEESDYHRRERFRYFLQLKFLPSPFQQGSDYAVYPPLEMLFSVDEFGVADSLLRAVRVERESEVMLGLPWESADVKFTTAFSKNLELGDIDLGVETDLENTEQPGVAKFLDECRLDFSEGGEVYIPESLEVEIDGKTVTYMYQAAFHRRELSFQYIPGRFGVPVLAGVAEEQPTPWLLQLSVVEGGLLGGRRVEVNLIAASEHIAGDEMDEEQFVTFGMDALSFVRELKHTSIM